MVCNFCFGNYKFSEIEIMDLSIRTDLCYRPREKAAPKRQACPQLNAADAPRRVIRKKPAVLSDHRRGMWKSILATHSSATPTIGGTCGLWDTSMRAPAERCSHFSTSRPSTPFATTSWPVHC